MCVHQSGEWPFETFCQELCQELFHQSWEVSNKLRKVQQQAIDIINGSHYALLALYPSIWTKSQLCPSCTIPFNWTKNQLCPSCTIPFNLDQESLIPFLHYTLQFGPRVTYALLALYPSIWTKSHLCPSQTKLPYSRVIKNNSAVSENRMFYMIVMPSVLLFISVSSWCCYRAERNHQSSWMWSGQSCRNVHEQCEYQMPRFPSRLCVRFPLFNICPLNILDADTKQEMA